MDSVTTHVSRARMPCFPDKVGSMVLTALIYSGRGEWEVALAALTYISLEITYLASQVFPQQESAQLALKHISNN